MTLWPGLNQSLTLESVELTWYSGWRSGSWSHWYHLVLPTSEDTDGRVLKVGVVDGSQPCAYRDGGGWTGMAVEHKRNGVVQQLRERAITAAVVKGDPS